MRGQRDAPGTTHLLKTLPGDVLFAFFNAVLSRVGGGDVNCGGKGGSGGGGGGGGVSEDSIAPSQAAAGAALESAQHSSHSSGNVESRLQSIEALISGTSNSGMPFLQRITLLEEAIGIPAPAQATIVQRLSEIEKVVGVLK